MQLNSIKLFNLSLVGLLILSSCGEEILPPTGGRIPDVRYRNDPVEICHFTSKTSRETYIIPLSKILDHVGHGDTLGPCQFLPPMPESEELKPEPEPIATEGTEPSPLLDPSEVIDRAHDEGDAIKDGEKDVKDDGRNEKGLERKDEGEAKDKDTNSDDKIIEEGDIPKTVDPLGRSRNKKRKNKKENI